MKVGDRVFIERGPYRSGLGMVTTVPPDHLYPDRPTSLYVQPDYSPYPIRMLRTWVRPLNALELLSEI